MNERKVLVCKTSALGAGQMKPFQLGVRKALLMNTGDGFKAYFNFCTHMGGPLKVCGEKFCCQWHHSEFDIKTGARLTGQAPPGSKLQELPLAIEGDNIFVLWTPPAS
jgi:nitrite reductase/ring-hydroxylating ferredoxin subunit